MNCSQVKKVLILDFSRIGDTLMHEPALRALKLHFAKARFYALTDRPNFDLLAHHPAITEAKVMPRVRDAKSFIEFMRKLRWIRQQKFDLLINFYMGGATASIARFSGIPLRLSFDKKKNLRQTYNLLAKAPSSYSNWIIETNEIVRPLGLDPKSIWPQVKFFVSPENAQWAKTIVPEQAYAVYQLAASEPAKCWPNPSFAALAKKLYREKNLIPVVITSPDQRSKTAEFFQHYPQDLPAIRLPVLSLDKIAAILANARILISGDTGVMHLGFAVNTPTVGIFTMRPEYVASATTNKWILFREDDTLPKFASGQLRGNINFSVDEVCQGAEQLLHKLSF